MTGKISDIPAYIKIRERISRERAKELMLEYYIANKTQYPDAKLFREEIIHLIEQGIHAAGAFEVARQNSLSED